MMQNSADYWLVRFGTLLARIRDFGVDDWTVDTQEALEDFALSYGVYGRCEVCGEQTFRQSAREPRTTDGTLMACAGCRGDVTFRAAA